MNGLLGTSWDDPKTMAVMNLAAGLMSGGNFGQALGRGLAGYSETMSNAKRQSLLDEQMQWKRDEINREKAEREKQKEIESNIQRLIRESFLPTTGPQAIAADASGPTPQKAEAIGQTRPINFQALAAQGVPFERLKQLAESQNLGRSKVARTVKGIGPDGKEYEYQVDEFGQKVGDGLAQFRAPIMQDLGGQVAALDPYNLNPIGQFKKSMTPDAQASNAVAWANNAVSRDRLNFEKNGGAGANKPKFSPEMGGWLYEPDMQNPGGRLVPIQGGNAVPPKLNEGEAKASLYLGQMRSASDTLAGLGLDSKSGPSPLSVGLAGSSFTNFLAPDAAQKVAQAQNQWSEAFLRAKTGAAATTDEVKLNNRTFFPIPGDSPEVVQQKAAARKQAEADMRLPAGRGANQVAPAKPKADKEAMEELPPANASNKNRVIEDRQTGQKLRSNGIQWVPEK